LKKHRYFFLCAAISLVLLAGCLDYQDSSQGAGNMPEENASGPGNEARDWEATIYKTVNGFSGVTMTVKEGSVDSGGLTVMLENKSGSRGSYGQYFCLEKKIDGTWYQLPVTIEGEYGFDDIGYRLLPGEAKELPVNWEWLHGTLEPGDYRIVKDILDFRGTGDFDEYYLAAEFTIG